MTLKMPRLMDVLEAEYDDEPVHIANPYEELPVALCGEPLVGDLVTGVDEECVCRVCLRIVRHIGGVID
jgi:hypothetical protein